MEKDQLNKGKLSLLDKWKNRSEKTAPKGIAPKPDKAAIPISYGQKRLWLLQQLFPANSFYNYTEYYRLKGDLNEEALFKSVERIFKEHDILRSNFFIEADRIKVSINNINSIDIVKHDLSNKSVEKIENEVQFIAFKEAQTTFDLANDVLVRIVLVRKSEKEHVLIITMHHIITDKWSMGVFRDQLAMYYRTLCNNEPFEISDKKLQYADFAFWQQQQKIPDLQLKYWKDKLEKPLPFLNLPLDFQRSATPGFKGAFHKKEHTVQLSEKVLTLCKQLDVTPYVFMLTAFYIILHRYTAQEDILIGTPISNRDHTVLEDMIGFFNDTLVLRCKPTEASTFKELLQHVKQVTFEAFSNKNVPFELLVNELKPERSLSTNPFFQVMFLYHAVPETPSFGTDLKLEHQPLDTGISKFDLTLYVSEDKGELSSIFEFSTELFETVTIKRMHEHFNILLEGIVNDPGQMISEIPMLTDEENLFLENTKQPERPFSFNGGIHTYIEKQAEMNPQQTAIVFKDKEWSYDELNSAANKLAIYLIKNGLKNNDIIGLCVERSPKMIIGLLAILKAGAAYLPIDPAYPKERINYILSNANAKALVTETKLTALFDSMDAVVFEIDRIIENEIQDQSVEFPDNNEDDLAYIIYTSGSSGQPKGVPISHKNIINSTLSRTDFYKNDPETFLLMSSISFDSSKVGIFWTLCTGGTLVISEDRMEQDMERMMGVIKSHNVTHTLMLPSLYMLLLKYGNKSSLTTLKTIIVAGESCPASLVSEHFNTLPDTFLYNEYGPTEASVWCTAHLVQKNDEERSVPIGKATANAELYILNENLKTVPFGIVGELFIGGIGLSKGYHNNEEATAKAFIAHPWRKDEKIYRTGDLARYRNDGTIEFLGRKDQQVKIRGFRIELDEIERVILSDASIEQAVVTIESQNYSSTNKLSQASTDEILNVLQELISDEEIDKMLLSVENNNEEIQSYLLENIEQKE